MAPGGTTNATRFVEPPLDVLDEPVDLLGVLHPPERRHARVHRLRTHAEGDHERVERQLLAGGRRHDGPVGIDRGDGVTDVPGAVVLGDLGERVPLGRTAHGERVLHAGRADREVLVGCDEGDRHAVSGEGAQGDERLEARHAASGDDDSVRSGMRLRSVIGRP